MFSKFLNRKKLQYSLLAVSIASVSTLAQAGFAVSGLELLDGNGEVFTMRGVNHAHTWYTSNTDQAIDDISSVNANTVRVVLSNGYRWNKNSAADVASLIEKLKAHKLIAVLEVHDTTGYGEDAAAAPLSSAVDYWLEIADVLKGEEDYVIINIGNEPFGNNVAADTWKNEHVDAIKRLRNAGLTHTIMVDAPSWGQDWENVMLNNATSVASADTLHNTLFSIHMYSVYSDPNKVNTYINQFRSQNQLPIVVGEFAADSIDGGDVAEEAIMSIADNLGVGYLGWSWSGNSGSDTAYKLDIVLDYNLDTLTDWGDTLINGEYGLKKTAQPASIFSDNQDNGSTDSGGGDGSSQPDNGDSTGTDGDTSNTSHDVNINIGAFTPWLALLMCFGRRRRWTNRA